MARDKTTNVGLIGGSLQERLKTSKVEPLDLEYVLAPYRREGDAERLSNFRSIRPFHVEIGFGRPHYICEFAASNPDTRILGFEVKRRWCKMASNRAAREGLSNIRVIEGDARAYMEEWSENESVDGFHVLFPDPWWKKRHHKRRLFSNEFVSLLHRLLKPNGAITFRTDVGPYADQVLEVMNEHGGFRWEHEDVGNEAPRSHREKKCATVELAVSSYRFIKDQRP